MKDDKTLANIQRKYTSIVRNLFHEAQGDIRELCVRNFFAASAAAFHEGRNCWLQDCLEEVSRALYGKIPPQQRKEEASIRSQQPRSNLGGWNGENQAKGSKHIEMWKNEQSMKNHRIQFVFRSTKLRGNTTAGHNEKTPTAAHRRGHTTPGEDSAQ